MPLSPDELLAYLGTLGIRTETRSHPPLRTVAESQALRGEIAGAHTKNLFLKDKKDRFFLLTMDEDAAVDLKTIHKTIGASGKVSFGSAERLDALLGVQPGAVTPFGAVNDRDVKVKVILDARLMQNAVVNAHPLTNEATTSIAAADLVRFLQATGHEADILKLAD
jgi:Ala-tRNA(Pro) deacylase